MVVDLQKISWLVILSILIMLDPGTMKAQAETGKISDSINKIYIGTYTKKEGHVDGKANGIYLVEQNSNTGSLHKVKTVAEVTNPSFVKVGRMGKYLFAVSELGPADAQSGYIYSYEIMEDGSLKEISKMGTGGFAPCHIALDRSNKFVFVSNYMGGVVMSYQIHSDGTLENKQKLNIPNPEKAHTHSVKLSGDNRFAYIADLGNDRIWIYEFALGQLKPHSQEFVQLENGAGPRHMAFSKNGTNLYSMNELNSSISVFKVDRNGGLENVQNISTLPESYLQSNSGADIHLHPSGKFLYASNRGHNSIAIFRIEETGKLVYVDNVPVAGKTPRNFAISPYGKYLYAASQDTGNITSYRIDDKNGKLKPIEPVFEIETPVCVEFLK